MIEFDIEKELDVIDKLVQYEPEINCKQKISWTNKELRDQLQVKGSTLMYCKNIDYSDEDRFVTLRNLIAENLKIKCFCTITEVDISQSEFELQSDHNILDNLFEHSCLTKNLKTVMIKGNFINLSESYVIKFIKLRCLEKVVFESIDFKNNLKFNLVAI